MAICIINMNMGHTYPNKYKRKKKRKRKKESNKYETKLLYKEKQST